MKRKLALMLTMTLLAGSLDSGMLVSAADFSAEESVEQGGRGAFSGCTFLSSIHILDMGWW